jgi:hypothetical protein
MKRSRNPEKQFATSGTAMAIVLGGSAFLLGLYLIAAYQVTRKAR